MGVGKGSTSNGAEDWRFVISQFLEGKRPGSKKEEEIMEMRARFNYPINGVLFRKMFLSTDAKCLSQPEGILVLREAHGLGK